ncbi:MAG: NADP-dependent malic enzyme [Alphaproteobacteria bacterium]
MPIVDPPERRPRDVAALLAAAERPAAEALRLHPRYRGKVQVLPKCPVHGLDDFAIWYTPGVAASCKAIRANPELVYDHTNRANTIAIVSDGTRVLGLGDIGPEAGLPVMEGKALLFKYLGGVDAVPLCLGTSDADELVRVVQALEPSFGGINLEDIAQPKCFDVLDRLRSTLKIPVWHDDQQGSATVILAALQNALAILGKSPERVRIALIGIGAANVATYRLLKAFGIDPGAIVACDSKGTLHKGRCDIESVQELYRDKWTVCAESNERGIAGGIAEALAGADICIAFSRSGPEIIKGEWVKGMAKDAIVFACANPVPEIWPWEALEAGARIVATGRSDFPNQVNNALVFPGLFRGVLDVRARTITDGMALAAAQALSTGAVSAGISEHRILPTLDDWRVSAQIAAATAMEAQREGLASLSMSEDDIHARAIATIERARTSTESLMAAGLMEPLSAP